MSAYGSKLDPYRKLREHLGVKGIRQSVVVTNNPSTIEQNQQLLVRYSNLGTNDVIVPRTARLAFTIELTSKDPNATVYQNLERAIVKKTTIKISGNEVMSIDDSDIFHFYVDLWKSPSERTNMAYYGIGKVHMLDTESSQETPLPTPKTRRLLAPSRTGSSSRWTLNC